MKVFEELYIKNFYTIDEFEWKIKDFNILTGAMGSGKSICVKLLWFLEHILYTLIFYPGINKDDLNTSVFLKRISSEFKEIFHTKDFDFSSTEIRYKYSCNGSAFDLQALCHNKKSLVWSSKYLDEHLEQWQKYFENKDNSLDIGVIVSNRIYDSISIEFKYTFPVGSMFIPATRAIAAITDNTDFLDPFIVRFIKTCKRLVRFEDELSDDEINEILHIKKIKYDEKLGLIITLPNENKISPQYLSSGQQELLYLLIYFNYMKHFPPYKYSTRTSIFIEEPEAHLFPQGQKEIIEYIVKTFRLFNDEEKRDNENRTTRFFITTHSPYLLNVISTMMNRGKLKIKLNESGKEHKSSTLSSCYFNKGEITAYFIDNNKKVKSIVSGDETYLNSEKINDISQNIFDEANSVDDELAEIMARKTQ
jgi:predicted ATP-dependent endonuclease of OLD family